jgi:hypothetical protein
MACRKLRRCLRAGRNRAFKLRNLSDISISILCLRITAAVGRRSIQPRLLQLQREPCLTISDDADVLQAGVHHSTHMCTCHGLMLVRCMLIEQMLRVLQGDLQRLRESELMTVSSARSLSRHYKAFIMYYDSVDTIRGFSFLRFCRMFCGSPHPLFALKISGTFGHLWSGVCGPRSSVTAHNCSLTTHHDAA